MPADPDFYWGPRSSRQEGLARNLVRGSGENGKLGDAQMSPHGAGEVMRRGRDLMRPKNPCTKLACLDRTRFRIMDGYSSGEFTFNAEYKKLSEMHSNTGLSL